MLKTILRMNFDDFPKHNLGEKYFEHNVFKTINDFKEFYSSISMGVMTFIGQGTKSLFNLDTYFYSSISGTLESINDILLKGKINDSYALLRKFYDSTMINIYTNLYLKDNFSFENLIVEKIENWRNGTETIPEYRVISKYIKESEKLKPISDLLKIDNRYKEIRDRCNDHTHYNYFHNLLINDNQIFTEKRIDLLTIFENDLINIFIQHFSYIALLNEHYMMSSDYIDSLEMGMAPEENSQYWVAMYAEKIFNDYVKIHRNDIAEIIKENVSLEFE